MSCKIRNGRSPTISIHSQSYYHIYEYFFYKKIVFFCANIQRTTLDNQNRLSQVKKKRGVQRFRMAARYEVRWNDEWSREGREYNRGEKGKEVRKMGVEGKKRRGKEMGTG